MARKIATATVAILLGLTVSASQADDVNYLEIDLLKYAFNGTDLYGIGFSAAKAGATTCTLATPSDPTGSPCYMDGVIEITHVDLTFAELMTEIGTGTGYDWILIWDEGLATETVATIDFTTVNMGDWYSLPTITNPLDMASGVPSDTSIDWTWPTSPALGNVWVDIYVGDPLDVITGPLYPACSSVELSYPPAPTTWDPPCLSPETWTAVVLNQNEYLRAVPNGIGISGDSWNLENSEWLAADSTDFSSFEVPEPARLLLLAAGAGVLVVLHRVSRRG